MKLQINDLQDNSLYYLDKGEIEIYVCTNK